MTSDDTTGRDDDGRARSRSAAGDPVRDLFLGVAAQIDQLAAMFAPAPRTASAGAADGAAAGMSTIGEISGEITSLIAELGDVLARLIAALIAVLEAVAAALRSTPASGSPDMPHYQAIAVRILDPEGES
ncbi:hypothetical protein AAFP30_03515 [Gordonia sp. CPCC 205515]|uniref:hypothetical protein n=1 Tax=Gordonia sp. CPCC 205515 TaxID=3140791 RepID=UPI003AF3D8C6